MISILKSRSLSASLESPLSLYLASRVWGSEIGDAIADIASEGSGGSAAAELSFLFREDFSNES